MDGAEVGGSGDVAGASELFVAIDGRIAGIIVVTDAIRASRARRR
jgi:hypothetical protein